MQSPKISLKSLLILALVGCLSIYVVRLSGISISKDIDSIIKNSVLPTEEQKYLSDNESPEENSGILFTTDKNAYDRGEAVRIVMKNNSDKTIYLARKSGCDLFNNIEEKMDNNWSNINSEFDSGNPGTEYLLECFDEISQNDFQYGNTETWTTVFRVELKPGESYEDMWDLTIGNKFIGGGEYRIAYSYGYGQDSLEDITEAAAHSNGFVVKEDIMDITDDNDIRTVSAAKEFSQANIKIELSGPEKLIKNSENKIKVIISGPNIGRKSLSRDILYANVRYDSLNLQPGVSGYGLMDDKYAACERTDDEVECVIGVTPACSWDSDTSFHVIVMQNVEPFRMNSSNLLFNVFNPAREICGNGVDDNCDGKIDGLDPQCAIFSLWVMPGEGATNLSRRAVSQYLEKNYTASYLGNEQKIYAEDYLRRKYAESLNDLKVGQQVDFQASDIEDAIARGRDLGLSDIDSLGKFEGVIDRNAYKFVSKTDSVADVQDLWQIDDKTKAALQAGGDFAEDEKGAWKPYVPNADNKVIIYYENADLRRIHYNIGMYMLANRYTQSYVNVPGNSVREMANHAVSISRDGIKWDPVDIGCERGGRVTYPGLIAMTQGGMVSGMGKFFVDVGDYNKGRLYVRFTLIKTKLAETTLGKDIKTNLDSL